MIRMEIIDENVAMLSNFEVYDLLSKSQKKFKGRPNGRSENLATITYETTDYLSQTPCVQQSSKIIEEFLKALKPYKLTKAEKLQLLNLRPASAVEIQLMVEEIEERFTEEEITKLLELVDTILPNLSGQVSMETSDNCSRVDDCSSDLRSAEQ